MNKFTSLPHYIFLGLIFILTACGGGGGGSSSGGSSLAGTWYGTVEDASNNMATLQVTIDSSNNITSIYTGGVNQNLTGTVTAESSSIGANLYSFVLSDTTEGGFYADSTHTYIAFIDEDLSYGVLQKGATSLPTYLSSDIAGSWSGYSVEVDAFLNPITEYSSSATVQTTGSFTAIGGGVSTTGHFNFYSSLTGRYRGTFSNSNGTGNVHAFLSANKQFAATWACTGSWPTGCSFSAWKK